MDSRLISDTRWYAKKYVGLFTENSIRIVYIAVGLDFLDETLKGVYDARLP
jgi:hypothetical protein